MKLTTNGHVVVTNIGGSVFSVHKYQVVALIIQIRYGHIYGGYLGLL